jgi:uncharacterized protein YjgD (DUF1641 family)
MAQPIPLELPRRDPRQGFQSRLENAPAEHAEAVLAAYEVLQALHDRGVLDMMRGALGASDKIIEMLVDATKTPESMRAIRNLLLLVKAIGAIEPELLSDFTRAIPRAFVQANAEEAKPPGLLKLISTFWNKDFRRGLSAFNDLLVVFGKNLTEKSPHPLLADNIHSWNGGVPGDHDIRPDHAVGR